MSVRDADKPAPVLDLDKIDSETTDTPPFVVTVKGKSVHFRSLEDLDWEVVERLRRDFDTREFLFEVIEDDDELSLFFEQKYKVTTLNRIMEDYFAHYGLDAPGDVRLNRAARRARPRR
jgi:hypothetical protein